MKIFLSWSGPRSRVIAEALNDWLKRVIQAVKPFYSSEIEKGAKWSSELDAALEGTRFGIICLTPDNLSSTWIHYEAGALSKTPDALIWTFLHGIEYGDVPQPLGKYQHTIAQKDDVLKLLKTINKRLLDIDGEPIDEAVLAESFEVYWPKLEEKLKAAETMGEPKMQSAHGVVIEKSREEREILLEVLEIVRSQQRAAVEPRPISSLSDTILTQPYHEAIQSYIQDFDSVYLKKMLERNHGNITRAAAEARMDRKTFRERWKQAGLPSFTGEIGDE